MPAARILIVEDECITAMDIEERLHQLGYSVPGVASSGEGAKHAENQRLPECIFWVYHV